MAEKRRRQGADVIPILYIIQGVLELYSEGQCRPTRLIETSIIGSTISTGTAGTRTALLGKVASAGKTAAALLRLDKVIADIRAIVAGSPAGT